MPKIPLEITPARLPYFEVATLRRIPLDALVTWVGTAERDETGVRAGVRPESSAPRVPDAADGIERLLLTVDATAEACAVSTRTVYLWMRHHGLPCLHIGGVRRVARRELVAWVAAQTRSDGPGASRWS